jgi:hypothetical protein
MSAPELASNPLVSKSRTTNGSRKETHVNKITLPYLPPTCNIASFCHSGVNPRCLLIHLLAADSDTAKAELLAVLMKRPAWIILHIPSVGVLPPLVSSQTSGRTTSYLRADQFHNLRCQNGVEQSSIPNIAADQNFLFLDCVFAFFGAFEIFSWSIQWNGYETQAKDSAPKSDIGPTDRL